MTGEYLACFLYQDFPFKEIFCVWLCVYVHMCAHTCVLKEEIEALDEPGLRKFIFSEGLLYWKIYLNNLSCVNIGE